jgi:hypothetical protein
MNPFRRRLNEGTRPEAYQTGEVAVGRRNATVHV